MCVIALKPRGTEFPTTKELHNCFDSNSHGAGVGWNDGKTVHWRKGFMTWKEFEEFDKNAPYKKLDVDVCYHFRISTSGGLGQGVTHPFPIVRDDILLNVTEGEGDYHLLFHNGIVSITERDAKTSDTQQYVLDVLADPTVLEGLLSKNPAMRKVVEMSASSSKFVILNKNGYLILNAKAGVKHNGMWYSNSSYSERVWSFNKSGKAKGYGTGLPFQDGGSTGLLDLDSHYDFSGSVTENGKTCSPFMYMNDVADQLFLSETKEEQKEYSCLFYPAGIVRLFDEVTKENVFTFTSLRTLDGFKKDDLDIVNARLRRTGTMVYIANKKLGVRATKESKVTVEISNPISLLLDGAKTLDGKEVPLERKNQIIFNWKDPDAVQLLGQPTLN